MLCHRATTRRHVQAYADAFKERPAMPTTLDLLTIDDVAKILGVSIRTVHDYVARGELQPTKLSYKVLRFTADNVAAFIERKTRR